MAYITFDIFKIIDNTVVKQNYKKNDYKLLLIRPI